MRRRNERDFYVYIMASKSRVLYIGVTNNLEVRVWQHWLPQETSFTSRYNVHRLVYCESFPDPREAIAREKELKGWVRRRKVALIEAANPGWQDLSDGWYN
ncbi:MAG: GIY-YIG nuclease family protein [Thermomicrobiales bacterium]